MARKHQLRKQRAGTVINLTSKKQETRLGKALLRVVERLRTKMGVNLRHERQWKISDIVARPRTDFPRIEFFYYFDTSAMRPDGGILSPEDKDGNLYPILIVEVKNQGTDDLCRAEGKPPQAKGNAIERLGKNVIGFRAAYGKERFYGFERQEGFSLCPKMGLLEDDALHRRKSPSI